MSLFKCCISDILNSNIIKNDKCHLIRFFFVNGVKLKLKTSWFKTYMHVLRVLNLVNFGKILGSKPETISFLIMAVSGNVFVNNEVEIHQ